MSDERKFHEMNEDELEQVSGGRSDGIKFHFRCPVCGSEEWLSHVGNRGPSCVRCILTTGKNVTMEPVN